MWRALPYSCPPHFALLLKEGTLLAEGSPSEVSDPIRTYLHRSALFFAE